MTRILGAPRIATALFVIGVVIYGAVHWRHFSYIEYNSSRVVSSIGNVRLRGLAETHGLAYRHPVTGSTTDPINVPYVSFIQGQLLLPGLLSRFIDSYVAVHVVTFAGLLTAAWVILRLCAPEAGVRTSERRLLKSAAPACAALAFLYSPHAFDEFFLFGDHPVAVLPWFVLTLAVEATRAHRRIPLLLPASYATIVLVNHSFLLLGVSAAFIESWEDGRPRGFLRGLASRLWLAGIVEGAYWGWLEIASPEYPHALFTRVFATTGLEGTSRSLMNGLRYLADTTGGLAKERTALARSVGELYVLLMAGQIICAGAVWMILLCRRAPLRVTERSFLITFSFYAVFTLAFRQAVLEHPYLYTPYLVIGLTVASFGVGPQVGSDRSRATRLAASGALWIGSALLATALVHTPWRFFDNFRLHPAYPDRAPVERLASYFSQRWRGQDAVLLLDSDDPETFVPEHLVINAAALAFDRDRDVRVNIVTTEWLREHPAARETQVAAYRISLRGLDVAVTTRRGPFSFAFTPTSLRSPSPHSHP